MVSAEETTLLLIHSIMQSKQEGKWTLKENGPGEWVIVRVQGHCWVSSNVVVYIFYVIMLLWLMKDTNKIHTCQQVTTMTQWNK